MSRLALSLLGPFQAALEGRLLVGFRSDKARALLVFLAVEADRPHARETLAGLLWPDYPNATALTYLRSALANLRHLLNERGLERAASSPPFLLITRETIQFNPTADASLDVVTLARLLDGNPTLSQLEQAVALCRGPFLEGFSIGHSDAFDEWLLFKREQFNRQTLSALHRLAATHIAQRQYPHAEVYARRQLALEPWDEPAHRQLMVSLALAGEGSAALVQYETCRRLLAQDLGVPPATETTELRDRIQAGALQDVLSHAREVVPPASPFVARGCEMTYLDGHLAQALNGNGRVVFVTGEAGSGKTTVLTEFARRAMASRGVVVASGACSSLIGLDDPYLPFREIIQMLTGDIEVRRAGGGITPEHAQRLWDVVPTAAEALADTAPGLIGRFVDAEALAVRAEAVITGRGGNPSARPARLADRLTRRAEGYSTPNGLEQTDVFAQITAFLRALARHFPLVLLIDDLQWADNGSISLLFHLARYVAGSRILVVGAYRPEDVALGRDGGRHPLAAVIHELQRDLGDIALDLDQADDRPFVSALLDSEPNQLGEAFRDTFYRHTEGQPLFAVELLASLRERRGLVRNAEGQWIESATLDWETLPARVEAVIAERVDRLPPEQQALLRAASVEGEEFTAEVVAQVQGMAERDVVAQLTYALGREGRLVRSHSVERVDGRRLSHYHFRHHLFWQYLYAGLDEPERVRLHEAVGTILESRSVAADDGAVEAGRAARLAWHFEQAGLIDKAVYYRHQAGDQAMRLAACEEAIAHYMRGLALLATLPPSPTRQEQEAALQLALSDPLSIMRGWGGHEMRSALTRAYDLAQALGARTQLLSTLLVLSAAYLGHGEIPKALTLSKELLDLAQQTQDTLAVAAAHQNIGHALFLSGKLREAREHLEQGLALYDMQPGGTPATLMGIDQRVSCQTWLAWVLWALGYPEQAMQYRQAAIARAEAMGHPATLVFALAVAGALFCVLTRETDAAETYLKSLLPVAIDKGLELYRVLGMLVEGTRQTVAGQSEAGIAEIQASIGAWQAMGTAPGRVLQLEVLVEAYRRAGQIEPALLAVDEALTLAQQVGLHYGEAEAWRLKGELLACCRNSHDAETEACFRHAIALARRQGGRLWELRATMSLARLRQRQGRDEEARQMLTAIFDWFSEGFDTPDLTEAHALLEELTYSMAH